MIDRTTLNDQLSEFEKYTDPVVKEWVSYTRRNNEFLSWPNFKQKLKEELSHLTMRSSYDEDLKYNISDNILLYFYAKVAQIKRKDKFITFDRLKRKVNDGLPPEMREYVQP